MTPLTVEPHPELDLRAFAATLAAPLADVPSPGWLTGGLRPNFDAPLRRDGADGAAIKAAVRDLLRHGGFKPTGRNKPASEYLLRAAAAEGGMRSINAVVDACNVVSLHSGLPISVVDLDRTEGPLRVAVAAPGSRYVFNPSGQEIDVSGLLALHDGLGPCANAVKDAQRTKTHGGTRRVLCIIWGTERLPGRAEAAARWYRELLERLGAAVEVLR